VVAVVGDGSAMFGLQALWSAAHERAPVTFIVVNNGEYRVLKEYTDLGHGPGRPDEGYIGMSLTSPSLSWADLARGFGVKATRVESGSEVGPALEEALGSEGPTLIDLVVAPREHVQVRHEEEGVSDDRHA
jgi:benzoylformate decarboxylase